MIPTSILIYGIAIAADVISFIFNELTENERKKQNTICSDVDSYNDKIIYFQNVEKQTKKEFEVEYYNALKEKREYLKKHAQERLVEEEQLHKDIKETIEELKKVLKDKRAITALRKNSLERLLNQLQEAKERCFGYQMYLKQYLRGIDHSDEILDVEAFEMRIPERYPYNGKIINLSADMFDENGYYQDALNKIIQIRYRCDLSTICTEKMQTENLPFLVEQYDIKEHLYILSLEKGRFSIEALNDTRMGVNVVVQEIKKEGIILCYNKKISLYLPKENLYRPYKNPPVRAELVVYPIRWNYGLIPIKGNKCSAIVSEKIEDATSSLNLKNFPLVISEEQWQEIEQYQEENELTELEDEWKIGPFDETVIDVAEGIYMKFQFGEVMVLLARLIKYEVSDNIYKTNLRLIPSFEKILPLDERFKSDDVFVDIDADMTPVSVNCLDKISEYIDPDNLQLFLFDVFTELKIQRQNKMSMSGARFFQQWEEVMQQLIVYLKKGKQFEICIDQIVKKDKNIEIQVSNVEELKIVMEQYSAEIEQKCGNISHFKVEYFFEDNAGIQYNVRFSANCTKLTIYNCDNISEDVENIIVYAQDFPYAEIQQKRALSQIRIGKMSNSVLQSAMMDGNNIEWKDSGKRLGALTNRSIQKNEAQYDALRRAFEEKNIFLIQGPPGTGKTTIIREIVEQYRKQYPSSRILIVSQANVAVDNALSGIAHLHGKEIVRCGNEDKINDELKPLSLEKRYGEYVKYIIEREEDSDIFDEWVRFVRPSKGIHPNIGELIIKNHMIVGATCVGLARKRIGLERIHFDLVIVDEAGKALPGEILIPILRAQKLILIGDHKQLPPVIHPALFDPDKIELENRALMVRDLFEISLFERLIKRTQESNRAMLKTQYRMPAVIGTLVSELFYNGLLENGAGTEEKQPIFNESCLVMYDFSKDKTYQELKKDNSIVNDREVQVVIKLLLQMSFKVQGHSIAVITPYRGQNRELQSEYDKHCDELKGLDVNINTIDAFQGDEADIVIYCSTRANYRTKYFSDFRRINVALSRAKNELIIIGSLRYFERYDRTDSPLPEIAKYIKKHGKVISMNVENSF